VEQIAFVVCVLMIDRQCTSGHGRKEAGKKASGRLELVLIVTTNTTKSTMHQLQATDEQASIP